MSSDEPNHNTNKAHCEHMDSDETKTTSMQLGWLIQTTHIQIG
jgi:hypothetical protein